MMIDHPLSLSAIWSVTITVLVFVVVFARALSPGAIGRWLAPLVDKVRVVMKKNRTGFGNYKAEATTYGNDLIVIKEGHRSNTLLRHEMVHVCQYDALGLEGFAHAYADQYVDSGYKYDNMPFEQDAFGFSSGHISKYLGVNNSRGAIYAKCKD